MIYFLAIEAILGNFTVEMKQKLRKIEMSVKVTRREI